MCRLRLDYRQVLRERAAAWPHVVARRRLLGAGSRAQRCLGTGPRHGSVQLVRRKVWSVPFLPQSSQLHSTRSPRVSATMQTGGRMLTPSFSGGMNVAGCGAEDTLLGAKLLRMPLNLQKEVQSQRARLLDGSEAVQIVTARMLILPMSHWLIDDVENTTARWLCAGEKVVRCRLPCCRHAGRSRGDRNAVYGNATKGGGLQKKVEPCGRYGLPGRAGVAVPT